MRMYDLIVKKRNGGVLEADEIRWMIKQYTAGNIPDYQMSAMMMAVYFQGMDEQETLELTLAMRDSGDILDLSGIKGVKVDKHSTGGVGDKTSITLAPLVSSVGVRVAKMSGRGLGHTGGTIDKLESFPGFSTGISTDHFFDQVNRIGIAIMGQTAELAPADKKLYALRDVTATVDNFSLIASSIMSKKLAAGADAIVLDVKCGSGAFMKKREDAMRLAEEMVKIGKGAGKSTTAFLTNMDQPLGFAVGNALEVKEAIDTLKGKGPEDFTKLCMTLGTQMVLSAGIAKEQKEAEEMLQKSIDSGAALDKLAEWVEAQGGEKEAVYQTERLPQSRYTSVLTSPKDGYIGHITCDEVGVCSLILGGGRETKESEIDLSVGIVLKKKTGDQVKENDVLAEIHYNDEQKCIQAKERLLKAYSIQEKQPGHTEIILDKVM